MTDPIPVAPQTVPDAPASPERGFPEETPLAQMTDAQRAAYWQHYARKHEDTVKGFKGLTPQQVTDMQTENDALKTDRLTADEKTLKTAQKEAADTATAAARAELLPKLEAAQVKAIASTVLDKDQLAAFMDVVSTSALRGDNGEVDEAKVTAKLAAMFGQSQQPSQRWQNAGQHSAPPPTGKPGQGGRAEAERRFGKKPNSTQ